MAAISVGTGTVKVQVRDVPCWWLLSCGRTVTLQRKDFVGRTVTQVRDTLYQEKGWGITDHFIVNGTAVQGAHVLQADDTLVLTDP